MAEGKWVATTTRPEIMGSRYMISAGHYLAAAAGMRILDRGGNAFDAGVAAGICVNVLQPDLTNIGGVAPICMFRADTGTVETISGLGWWPDAADPEYFRQNGGRIGRGVRRCVMPAAMDAWLLTLKRHGSMRFSDIIEPAIELAEDGYAMYPVMHETLSEAPSLKAMRQWPATRAVFLPDGENPVAIGQRVVQRDLARTFRTLAAAEQGAASREAGIDAVRACFYTGEVGAVMAKMMRDEGGWMTGEDLAAFKVEVEPPVKFKYRGFDVYACGPWCQGPVVPMTLNILEGYDIGRFGANSAQVYHLVIEALKAAFADRDRYFIDPRFGTVPMDGLLSPEYGAAWRKRIDEDKAAPGMPEPGDAWAHSGGQRPNKETWRFPAAVTGTVEPDTSYLCVVDGAGNAFSATPSDGVTSAPLVPGHGFMVSSRGMQSWLDPDHPAAMAPRKRPRLTPSPGMVLKDGRLVMPYGTPGNDVQPQAMVQFLINVIDFGMNVQEAMEAPRCATYSYPRSSDPHPYSPGLANIEGRAAPGVLEKLQSMGHGIRPWPNWTGLAGSLGAIRVDHDSGILHGGADPRRTAYAIGR